MSKTKADAIISIVVITFIIKFVIVFKASWILLLSSMEVWSLILARALVGINMSGCYVTCPIYTKEISEDSIRGALGCLVILNLLIFHLTRSIYSIFTKISWLL